MSNPVKTSRMALSNELLDRLADLGKVPPKERKFFFESIRYNVQTVFDRENLSKELSIVKAQRLHRAALDLYDEIGRLNTVERRLIEWVLGRSELFDRISSEGAKGLRKTTYQLASLFSLAAGKPPPRFPHQTPLPRQRGPKKGTAKDWIYQDFVFDFYTSAITADGKFTLDVNGLNGTLINAIELLAPYVPDGGALKKLSPSTLRRIKSRCNRIQQTSEPKATKRFDLDQS
jgi:hypothetical protein